MGEDLPDAEVGRGFGNSPVLYGVPVPVQAPPAAAAGEEPGFRISEHCVEFVWAQVNSRARRRPPPAHPALGSPAVVRPRMRKSASPGGVPAAAVRIPGRHGRRGRDGGAGEARSTGSCAIPTGGIPSPPGTRQTNTMTSHSGAAGPLPAAQVETFSSANVVVVGVLLDLLAAGSQRAASAWLHAHTAFVEGERSEPQQPSVTRLIVWPYGQNDELSLRSVLPTLEDSLARRAGYLYGYKGSEHRTPLLLELRDGTQHPGPARHQQLQRVLDLAYSEAEPAAREALGNLRAAFDRARISVAGSKSCGRYDVVHLSDCDDKERVSLQALIPPVADALHAHGKSLRRRRLSDDGVFLNNFSPVTADVTVDSALRSSPAQPHEQTAAPLTIGVITPGGTAAPRDVLGKLEHVEGITVHQVVVPRGAVGLTSTMVRAADTLLLQHPAAIIAGYGGGRQDDLDPVLDALQAALSA